MRSQRCWILSDCGDFKHHMRLINSLITRRVIKRGSFDFCVKDFTSLYTKIPLGDLKARIGGFIRFAFERASSSKGGFDGIFVSRSGAKVRKEEVVWSRPGQKPDLESALFVDAEMLVAWMEWVVDNTYFQWASEFISRYAVYQWVQIARLSSPTSTCSSMNSST